MPWMSEEKSNKYWIPEVEPEKTEEWQSIQLEKVYLKPDGSTTGHPKWYFGSGAYASDEYLYHNYQWLTIIDDSKPGSENEKYIVVELPISEWETFDTYKIRKTYKKYLYTKVERPEFQFGKTIQHSYDYDEANMTASDTYSISTLTDERLESEKNRFLDKVRMIRNYILEKTDYIVSISKEKNQQLSEDFINYRQSLRDLPIELDLNTLTETDYNKTTLTYSKFVNFGGYKTLKIEDIDISFLPQKPENYFI
jgi:hypothetical protein